MSKRLIWVGLFTGILLSLGCSDDPDVGGADAATLILDRGVTGGDTGQPPASDTGQPPASDTGNPPQADSTPPVSDIAPLPDQMQPDMCVPACAAKQCGPDGCGGQCGTCSSGYKCNSKSQCEKICVPSCSGKSCGSDGCSGSCGSCSSGYSCSNYKCTCSSPTTRLYNKMKDHTYTCVSGSSTYTYSRKALTFVYSGSTTYTLWQNQYVEYKKPLYSSFQVTKECCFTDPCLGNLYCTTPQGKFKCICLKKSTVTVMMDKCYKEQVLCN